MRSPPRSPMLIRSARMRMDATLLHADANSLAGSEFSNEIDTVLADIWDWCAIKGCRSVCLAGRLFMKKDGWDKFR